MSGTKKPDLIPEDQISAKVQRKFDIVFPQSSGLVNGDSEDSFDESTLSFESDGDTSMGSESQNKSSPKIDLDFSDDGEMEIEGMNSTAATRVQTSDEEFVLDFGQPSDDLVMTPNGGETDATRATELVDPNEGFSLEGIEGLEMDQGDVTKKTIVFDLKSVQSMMVDDNPEELEEFEAKVAAESLMTREETRSNIESTIKDILRPKFNTQEIVLSELTGSDNGEIMADPDFEPTVMSYSHTPSSSYMVNDVIAEEVEESEARPDPKKEDDVVDFDLSRGDEGSSKSSESLFEGQVSSAPAMESVMAREARPRISEEPSYSSGSLGNSLGTEDSIRFQSTIRQLREEREELLEKIKTYKADSKEIEQDNLSLKASLDEAKIEISILRKRHMVELEDMKYRLAISEEKKSMADEKARQADLRREKLEQKVRIDFNQVKQREKELESKLELLSMDVDSQVQSRDMKILELRRKIDALEFNMENTTIKEQKSLDDKRKLEDRLNKIMKTLRNSIKNLEDDIDLAQDDDHNVDKN